MKPTESKGAKHGQRLSVVVDNARGQSFQAGGLADLARAGYQGAPLTVTDICPRYLTLPRPEGTDAVRGSRRCAVIYGPRGWSRRKHPLSVGPGRSHKELIYEQSMGICIVHFRIGVVSIASL
jgi:hypothetical protein